MSSNRVTREHSAALRSVVCPAGLVTWCHNSQVVHATSAEPEGPYERKEVVRRYLHAVPDMHACTV